MTTTPPDDDPYLVLGISPGADDATVRRRYLELVREFPPEKAPERFAQVREAYERVKDPIVRVKAALFRIETEDTIRAIANDLRKELARARLPLETVLELAERSPS